MEFEPLLPPDDAGSPSASRRWAPGRRVSCTGSARRARFRAARCRPTSTEVLSDFAEVSRAGAVGSESAEVEETALAELVEYVRVGVQLIYDELADLRAAQTDSTARH